MPLGGIGAGCISFNGYGGFQDFAIRNRPHFTALPDGHGFTDAAFAVVRVTGVGEPWTRLLEGPIPPEKVYDQGLQAQGYRKGGQEGLPRFKNAVFRGEYPFGTVELTHPGAPVSAVVTAWSPLIPGDDLASGLPAALVDYAITNISGANITLEFTFHLSHLAVGKATGLVGTRNGSIPGGVHFTNVEPAGHESFGSAAIVALDGDPDVKAMWLRGGWFDPISALWRELSEGTFTPNDGTGDAGWDGGNGGSIRLTATLAPGETANFPVAVCWHFPNVAYAVGRLGEPSPEGAPAWRPFYAGRFADAAAVASHLREHHVSLRRRTDAFREALFGGTLPVEVVDAISANLAILKSPTVLRQENGNVWGWEGCFTGSGCCHGTCTHVWNYAQALPHLFPALERTLREQELRRSMDDAGHINFRAALPDGPTRHDYHAASDGQLGGILKLFRDWRICGDTEWLKGLYPEAKRSLEYCIRLWDPDERGALFEPHHNTYDIEFWGPDGMCTSVYLGALAAMARIAEGVGATEDARRYAALAERSGAYLDTALFNGEFYHQLVDWTGLKDQSFARSIAENALMTPRADTPPDVLALLRAEGPKYQYGAGCISDGVIGIWMADFYGVELPVDRSHVGSHLDAIFRHNFKADLSEHACTQRPGYAIAGEGGLLLCSWPRGGKPTLPFPYSDEVWTGIEYQVAAHLIHMGRVDAGLTIVRAARARYDGRARNPYNEYECGNFYARALASYALLQACTGFRYDAVDRTLWLRSDAGTAFFAAASGWGTFRVDARAVTLAVEEGELAVDTLRLGDRTISVGHVARSGARFEIAL